MKINIRIIFGILFLIISAITITLTPINPLSPIPSRSNMTRRAAIIPSLGIGDIVTQELVANNDYFNGISLFFTLNHRINTNQNILLILDSTGKILHRESFSSLVLKEGDLSTFYFNKPVFVGKGNKISLVLYSPDGTTDNSASVLINLTDSIGGFHVSKLVGNDVLTSIKDKTRHYHASLMLQTYKTKYGQFWFMKILLYTMALIISLIIIFFFWIRSRLAKTTLRVEWIFAYLALPFSVIFALITPPTQVPDEGSHFYRSYQISEFRFTHTDASVPTSLVRLDTAFSDLHAAAANKTTLAEIAAHLKDRLEPQARTQVSAPGYTLPYLPQALGILLGRLVTSSPLILMYIARLFNLLTAIIIVFFAIRITPSFKWLFLILALMPKTMFLFGSLSYDTLTIGISFFTIAIFLYYAYDCKRNLQLTDLALMGLLTLLLLFCKPPYFLLALLFFLIPPKKFGVLYKYIMISIGVVALGLFLYKGLPVMTAFFQGTPFRVTVTSSPETLFRPDVQLNHIMNDIPSYIILILNSAFIVNHGYVLESFVGFLGWIDVELPKTLTYSFLLFLVISALMMAEGGIKLGLLKKSLLSIILLMGFLIIETAMYLYATSPAKTIIHGVQGRYFIPLAPLVFMLFYNRYLNTRLNLLFTLRRKEYKTAKPKIKPEILKEILEKEQLFNKSFYLFTACFCMFTLAYAIYLTLIRYYNIL